MSPAPGGPSPGGPFPGDERPAVLVSACLLGVACNHEGRAARRDLTGVLARHARVIPVCPEVLGGLATPRAAAEIRGGDGAAVLRGAAAVVNAEGEDVTSAYRRGAGAAVALARATGARLAVLKARSPSCGSEGIYDGTFSRTLVAGQGVTAAALRDAGLEVRSDEEVATGSLPEPGR